MIDLDELMKELKELNDKPQTEEQKEKIREAWLNQERSERITEDEEEQGRRRAIEHWNRIKDSTYHSIHSTINMSQHLSISIPL
jgi:hypothetical protein